MLAGDFDLGEVRAVVLRQHQPHRGVQPRLQALQHAPQLAGFMHQSRGGPIRRTAGGLGRDVEAAGHQVAPFVSEVCPEPVECQVVHRAGGEPLEAFQGADAWPVLVGHRDALDGDVLDFTGEVTLEAVGGYATGGGPEGAVEVVAVSLPADSAVGGFPFLSEHVFTFGGVSGS